MKSKKSSQSIISPLKLQGASCELARAAREGEIELRAIVHGDYPGTQLPENVLPGLGSVGGWNATKNQTWGKDWHRHEIVEFIFVEAGRLTVSFAENRAQTVLPGQLIISRPWQMFKNGSPKIEASRVCWVDLDVHAGWPNQKWSWPDWIVLTEKNKRNLEDLLRANSDSVFNTNSALAENYSKIGKLINQIESGLTGESRLILEINDLMLNLLEMLQSQTTPPNSLQNANQQTVEEFLTGLSLSMAELQKPWSVKLMARECGMGETLFTSCCRKKFNKTPGDFLRTIRLEKAAELLISRPELSVTDVALLCGFTRQTYFTGAFTVQYGVSPRAFRANEVEKC